MMEKNTINVNLPNTLSHSLSMYAKYHGIKKPASIAYLLHKQIFLYCSNKDNFDKKLKKGGSSNPKQIFQKNAP